MTTLSDVAASAGALAERVTPESADGFMSTLESQLSTRNRGDLQRILRCVGPVLVARYAAAAAMKGPGAERQFGQMVEAAASALLPGNG